jgi:hypothetical protein
MFLAGFVILVDAVGGILLFLWGPYFFSSTMALIFGGFSVLQAVTAGIAFLGLCNVSTRPPLSPFHPVSFSSSLPSAGSTEILCYFLYDVLFVH